VRSGEAWRWCWSTFAITQRRGGKGHNLPKRKERLWHETGIESRRGSDKATKCATRAGQTEQEPSGAPTFDINGPRVWREVSYATATLIALGKGAVGTVLTSSVSATCASPNIKFPMGHIAAEFDISA
jgi:hypothetical protein